MTDAGFLRPMATAGLLARLVIGARRADRLEAIVAAKIREGWIYKTWPAILPSGEGTDLAGIVKEIGPAVEEFTAGDKVVGFTDRRASHADQALRASAPTHQCALPP
jgi:hypothetical protein